MSVRLPRKNLTRKQEEFIVEMLTVQPVERNQGMRGRTFQQEKESIPFFEADKNFVKVPYAFGINLLETFPHEEKEYHPISLSFAGQLRPRQVKRSAIMDEHFENYRTSTLRGHTGFGKTTMGNYYIAQHHLLTVVLVPGKMLNKQWPNSIQDSLPGVKVGVVGEGYEDGLIDLLPSGEINWKAHPDVLVCMPERWNKIPEEVREKVGFLIVDEAHMFCTPTRIVPLLQFEPKYILALTASPRRSDGTIGILHAMCGVHQVKARYPNLVEVWRFNTGYQFKTEKDMRGQTSWVSTLKNIVTSDERNNMTADLAQYLVEGGRKPMLMCDRKYHVDDLVKKIKARGVTCDYLMENKNDYINSQVLIAIITKGGTGFDEQYACPDFTVGDQRIDTVMYCTSFRELNGLIQYGGRCMRVDNPLIIHLVDKNGIVESHWREAQKYYKSGEYLKKVEIKTFNQEDIWVIEGGEEEE